MPAIGHNLPATRHTAAPASLQRHYYKISRRNINTFMNKASKTGWASPNWNWGYAVGDAHDLAMTTRSKLRTEDARKTFLANLAAGSVDLEEVKMVFALTVQLANHRRQAGPLNDVLMRMAAVSYEGEDGPTLLASDIYAAISTMPNDDARQEFAATAQVKDAELAIGIALVTINFVEAGL
ncbi:hypothetical protein RI054_20g89800 [Pseudoscourfieldia marina]